METQPVDRIEDSQSGETPEDAAIPFSWANPQGAKYRDFSADRREYRAQMRHRAAEQLRLVELKAQSEAEAAAAEAEAVRAKADAATVSLAASRGKPAIAPQAIQGEEEEAGYPRSSSLRDSARQAGRAASERLQAARRAEAAALADSIARRKERELAEADVWEFRRAARNAESDPRRTQMTPHSQRATPGRISGLYSPPILAEGERFETPDPPVPESEANRSRWFAIKRIFAHTGNGSSQDTQTASETNKEIPIIAVFSIAGGVGKTTLVATLGRTLSSLGEKVLLADTTSHGLLPFYFRASEPLPGEVKTLLPPSGRTDAPVHLVSYGTDLDPSERSRDRIVEDLLVNSQRAHRVLVDLGVNCRWLVERVARLQPTVLVPLSADMNSIISLQSVERSFAGIRDAEGEPLRPLYLLNQFDPSLPLHMDVREMLRRQLGDRLLPFVIRRTAGVSEALAEGMTIVDYGPESLAAQDYLGLANWIRARSEATVGYRKLRWSERLTSSR